MLLIGALDGIIRRFSNRDAESNPRLNAEIVLCCAILHVAFICFFFGNAWAWTNYPYLLFIGLAALAPMRRVYLIATILLTLMAIVGQKSNTHEILTVWRDRQRSEQTLGLWCSPAFREEWVEARRQVQGERPVLLSLGEYAALRYTEFQPPATWLLLEGVSLKPEIERKLAQLREANVVVVALPTFPGSPKLVEWPQFEPVFRDFEPAWKGRYFAVYRRGGAERTAHRGTSIEPPSSLTHHD